MQSGSLYSNLYEQLVQAIRAQEYQCGDVFPTVDQLCKAYFVSSKTAKSALKLLRKDGYISTGSGRATKVVFRQSAEEYEAYARQFFLERQGAFQDLFASTVLVQHPQMIEGICRMDEDAFEELYRLADRAGNSDIVRFHYLLLNKMKNPLVLNLFRELLLFEGYPLLYSDGKPEYHSRDTAREGMLAILDAGRRRDRTQLQHAFLSFQKEIIETISDKFYKKVDADMPVEEMSFTWRIYREHPQVCYKLGSFLLHHIIMGEYREREYLPSYSNLVKITGLPTISVRRTVSLLQKMGVVQSVKGKGIRILTAGLDQYPPDVSDPAVRRNLAYFFYAFEMFAYSCKSVTLATLPHLTQQEKNHLMLEFEAHRKANRCVFSIFSYLICVIRHCPQKAVREIYSKIYGLLLWGYPLSNLPEAKAASERNFELLTNSMLQALAEKDSGGFIEALRTFSANELPKAENFLLQFGITPEELRPS